MKNKYLNFRNITLVVSFLLLVLILSAVDWNIIKQYMEDLSVKHIILLIAAFMTSMLIHSLRFSISLTDKFPVKFLSMYNIAMIHVFYLSVLPARLGELSYIKMLSEYLNIPEKHSIISLVSCRLYDVIILSVFGIYSFYFILNNENIAVQILMLSMIFLSILTFIYLNKLIFIVYILLLKLSKYTPAFISNKITKNIKRNNINAMNFSLKTHLKLLVTTIGTWTFMLINYGIILNMFGVEFRLPELILIVALVNLSNLVPLQTIGGFGIKEAALVFSFVAIGMSLSKATSLAVVARLILYLISLIISSLFLSLKKPLQ